MLIVDPEIMSISMTRGDTANIIFGAKSEDGEVFHPTLNDRIIFSVAKKFGEEPLITIMNKMESNEEEFWTIQIEPELTSNLAFGKYVYDVQIEIRDSSTDEITSIYTIIGKTSEISPYFTLWGEVSKESD